MAGNARIGAETHAANGEPRSSMQFDTRLIGPADTARLFADARILVVDDVDANLMLLERLLRSAGIAQVEGLTDPRRVADRCLEWQPDLVLLDLHMPEMDGVEVLEVLRATLPDDSFVPVLVLTADGTPAARAQALAAGAKDFLAKPIDRTEVLLRVQNLLETRALYVRVQRHNTQLQNELDRKFEQERQLAEQRRVWTAEVNRVLTGDELRMVFQPVVDLVSGDVVGVEALSRFDGSPQRPPNEWFAIADGMGLGVELELLAVKRALAQIDDIDPSAFMSVNVSPTTAMSEELRRCLAVAPGHRVVVELTEHARVRDYEALWPAFDELRAQGVRIAVDDAGAGYSGLQHILRLQPDILKLDNDLTRHIHVDPARRALAAAMTTFAHEIGASLVAEGIETREDLEALQAIGIPWGQGYHLAPPGALPLDRGRLGVSR
jgi:EAL domain-containing protein (putative c-di-GMP-specific phosphodiesterase class I)/AmiR/NasT family two-component response regulator